MNYNFKPINLVNDSLAVVKKIEGKSNYSTHLGDLDFEIDESNNMFICGKEYQISEELAKELYESGYSTFIDPEYIPQ